MRKNASQVWSFFLLFAVACSEDSATTGEASSSASSSSTATTAASSTGSMSTSTTSSTTGAGGSGGGGSPVVGEDCVAFGEAFANCRENCTFDDLVVAAQLLGEACQSSLDALVGPDKNEVTACVNCAAQASGSSCDVPFDFDGTPECETLCSAAGPGRTFTPEDMFFNHMAANLSDAVTCTNGRKPLQIGNCTASGEIDPPTCDAVCCNGFACVEGNPSSADVAVHCTGGSPVDCTCTVGTNINAMFQFASCDELWAPYMTGYDVSPLWALCNL